jgi:hypothetical protein
MRRPVLKIHIRAEQKTELQAPTGHGTHHIGMPLWSRGPNWGPDGEILLIGIYQLSLILFFCTEKV